MFFKIGKVAGDNYPNHYTLTNGLVLSTDDGWQIFDIDGETVYIKGYANNYDIQTVAKLCTKETVRPSMQGNFAAFYCCKDGKVYLRHSKDRSFPIYVHQDRSIENLQVGIDNIWADNYIDIDSNLEISHSRSDPFIDYLQLEDDKVVDNLDAIICETFESFLTTNTLPLKLFLSGGIDTCTLWAYLDKFTKNYELLDYSYVKYTPFYKKNKQALKQHQFYQQTHLFAESVILLSGALGDENFMRNPISMGAMLKYNGIDIYNELLPEHYMYWYIKKKDLTKDINTIIVDCDSINTLRKKIVNIHINDHQHWHLDNTLHFTPFKDVRILNTMVCASPQLILKQGVDAHVNRLLIERHNPDCFKILSKWKNYNSTENL
jgi:hypothetical protein